MGIWTLLNLTRCLLSFYIAKMYELPCNGSSLWYYFYIFLFVYKTCWMFVSNHLAFKVDQTNKQKFYVVQSLSEILWFNYCIHILSYVQYCFLNWQFQLRMNLRTANTELEKVKRYVAGQVIFTMAFTWKVSYIWPANNSRKFYYVIKKNFIALINFVYST